MVSRPNHRPISAVHLVTFCSIDQWEAGKVAGLLWEPGRSRWAQDVKPGYVLSVGARLVTGMASAPNNSCPLSRLSDNSQRTFSSPSFYSTASHKTSRTLNAYCGLRTHPIL